MWKINLIESEKGWGQKLDEVKKFDTREAAEQFKREFNSKNNLDYVPDWYMYAEGPYPVD